MSKKNKKIRDKKRKASVPASAVPKSFEKEEAVQAMKNQGSQRGLWFFVFSLFFLEMLFRASTVKEPWGITIFYTFLFSFVFAGTVYFLTSLIGNRKIRHGFRMGLLVAATVWFIINYFVFSAFRMFYDVRTVFAGGGDAAGGFGEQIAGMVLSPSGIMHILLFILPAVLYSILHEHKDLDERFYMKHKKTETSVIAASLAISPLSISRSSCFNVMKEEYSYQAAVSDFGLMAGGILDLLHSGSTSHFEMEEGEPAEEEPAVSPEAEAAPAVYGDNALDIDFDALMRNADSVQKELDGYVSGLKPSEKNEWTGKFAGKNLIFLSAEAFSGYLIDPQLTPTLYRLSTKGIRFTDYCQPASAGTTGGEYENIFGMMPSDGGSSFKETVNHNNSITIGYQLDQQGYNGWAFHANDYTYYDRDRTHSHLGYSNGFMGYGNGMEQYVEKQWPQSDLEMMEGTVDLYLSHQPFNVYYMTVSGHNPYDFAGGNAMSKKHEAEVQDLPYNDEVKAYIAANLELEDALTYLVRRLEEAGIADDTVIVLGADHFPYGLDYGKSLEESESLDNLYGFRVSNYLERDRNRLIIWSGCLEKEAPATVDTPVSSIDILPTLCNLFGVAYDSRLLPGRDVFSDAQPLVFDMGYDWKTEKGTYLSGWGRFIPASDDTFANEEEQQEYVRKISTMVHNKMNYCANVLHTDYFRHVFGQPHDPLTPRIIQPAPEPISEASAGTENK